MDAFLQSLQTGFIDKNIHSNEDYLPQFLVNDKVSGKKVLTSILQKLKKCDEFWFSVAFVTSGGVAALINTLSELIEKGIKGKILVSQYLNFTQPEALRKLLQLPNIELKIIVDSNFHSKGYLFKTSNIYDLIIGSSNLTASALSSNIEWNLKISATSESDIIFNALREFTEEFKNAIPVDSDFINSYYEIYTKQYEFNREIAEKISAFQDKEIKPNSMQIEALENIEKLRKTGKTKALLISATGTGKTHLSAFDVKRYKPNRFLFVVHRANIANAAMKTFKQVVGTSKSYGIYSGGAREKNADFIFSTIQTISKEEHLTQFDQQEFDYIVIDETHRAGAESYQRILNHFKPKFLLGMTATPERTDGFDIFKLFDHTIAYEIRLHKALEEDMLSPFHYFGVTDIEVNGKVLDENADFTLLTAEERINRIIEKAGFFGSDNGQLRGLIFCSKIEECKELSIGFNKRGFNTVSLTGENTETERAQAINRLEADKESERLHYIFTVDIFNEGIDIPRVNQVIMLRPTQSAIVFVQQLGRGLRKTENKEYLTVIDFIANYSNNYLVPIALYGDTSYNKDSIRKLMASGSSLIPGESTVNFDRISRDRIYQAIDAASMQKKKDLLNDYNILKFKLGRVPMMIDFIEHGSRDPQLYVNYSKSYFNFVQEQEEAYKGVLSEKHIKLLELLSSEINNSKRLEESILLRELMDHGSLEIKILKEIIASTFGYNPSDNTIQSAVNNLNFEFVRENYRANKEKKSRLLPLREIYQLDIIKKEGNTLEIEPAFEKLLSNSTFVEFLKDSTEYSINTASSLFNKSKFIDGFVLYRKYSRKDVFRILNWENNPMAQNVGGYMISPDKSNCPIFVNYHKEEHISSTTKYEDGFINNSEFEWMSKSKRKLNSPDVQIIRNYRLGLRLPLFIKKNNDEGTEFYYMGDVTPIDDSFEETTMSDDKGKPVSVVKIVFKMNQVVESSIYNYLTNDMNS